MTEQGKDSLINTTQKQILVTGGAGFIGTNLVKHLLATQPDGHIVNLDALTYAGNPANHVDAESLPGYTFIHGSITDAERLNALFAEYKFDVVFHLAAESHVDRSIRSPEIFIETNVTGTFRLLEAARAHCLENPAFRFIHISTDEVYGSLGFDDAAFTEETPYAPSSPYAASKAASDHLAKAYFTTYGLPVMVTNCSNNYGPYQFPEKLIPLTIANIIDDKPLPVYGKGENIRDWLYVTDHCEALGAILQNGTPGQTYNIGGGEEKQNIEVVETICDIMDQRLSRSRPARDLITFVTDRPGHDLRYAINPDKTRQQIGWQAAYTFKEALAETIGWYLGHPDWVQSVQTGEYKQWIKTHYNH